MFLMDRNNSLFLLLAGRQGIRTFTSLVNHEEAQEVFRRYTFIIIGHNFDLLYSKLKAEAAIENSWNDTTAAMEGDICWDA